MQRKTEYIHFMTAPQYKEYIDEKIKTSVVVYSDIDYISDPKDPNNFYVSGLITFEEGE